MTTRRNRLFENTPAEMAIRHAVMQVEFVGAHQHLTDAVILLQNARECVADFVDGVPVGESRVASTRLLRAQERVTALTQALARIAAYDGPGLDLSPGGVCYNIAIEALASCA